MQRSAKTDEAYLSFVLKYFLAAHQGKIRDISLCYCHNREVIFKGDIVRNPKEEDKSFNYSARFSFPPRYKVVDYLLLFGFKLYQHHYTKDGDEVRFIRSSNDDDESQSLEIYYDGFYAGDIETEAL